MEVGLFQTQWVEDGVEAAVGVRTMVPGDSVVWDTRGSCGSLEWEGGRTVSQKPWNQLNSEKLTGESVDSVRENGMIENSDGKIRLYFQITGF